MHGHRAHGSDTSPDAVNGSQQVTGLRLAVLGDFEGPHTRRWLRIFVERGHEVHAISFYRPKAHLDGVRLHLLHERPTGALARDGAAEKSGTSADWLRRTAGRLVPPSAQRLVQAGRYARAGLAKRLLQIAPDVFHAHYAVEHGFFGSFAGFHPYVVSGWGSDLYLAPRTVAGRLIARRALSQADLVTVNDPAMGRRALALGVPPQRLALVRLGVGPEWVTGPSRSANLSSPGTEPPTVVSDRALEPLYNLDVVIRAFALVRAQLPSARLLIAGDGSQRGRLEALARAAGQSGPVKFLGHVPQSEVMRLLSRAHVYVSVPSSDSLALSTMEAMACGAFPVVSDLPSQDGWIEHRVNGLRVPARDVAALAGALLLALSDAGLRRTAVAPNRALVEAEGALERNMLLMERHYYRLAGRPAAESI